MALEVLKDVAEIGGFKVGRDEINAETPIVITEPNIISFQLQDGPIKEHGVNGCQIQTLMETAFLLVAEHNERFPCKENKGTMQSLKNAITWQELRTRNRTNRGVEGTNKE